MGLMGIMGLMELITIGSPGSFSKNRNLKKILFLFQRRAKLSVL